MFTSTSFSGITVHFDHIQLNFFPETANDSFSTQWVILWKTTFIDLFFRFFFGKTASKRKPANLISKVNEHRPPLLRMNKCPVNRDTTHLYCIPRDDTRCQFILYTLQTLLATRWEKFCFTSNIFKKRNIKYIILTG